MEISTELQKIILILKSSSTAPAKKKRTRLSNHSSQKNDLLTKTLNPPNHLNRFKIPFLIFLTSPNRNLETEMIQKQINKISYVIFPIFFYSINSYKVAKKLKFFLFSFLNCLFNCLYLKKYFFLQNLKMLIFLYY